MILTDGAADALAERVVVRERFCIVDVGFVVNDEGQCVKQ